MSVRYVPNPDEFDENSPQHEQTTELATRRDTSRAVAEVQAAMIIAKRFPRNEDEARIKLVKSCKRPAFAEEAEYVFPRGGNDVSGPSVVLAREAARVWGNIESGFEIIQEDEVWRAIRGWAWDKESNTKKFQEDRFKKLIQRKNKQTRATEWVKPDERDLRELTNRRAAICERNCILQLIPKDFVDEAIEQSHLTLRDRAAADPDGERKRICDAFATYLNVMPTTLDQLLGHPISQASPAEIAQLRAIFKSIRDGNSTINEYIQQAEGADSSTAAKSNAGLEAIRKRHEARTSEGPAGNPQTAPVSEASSQASTTPEPEILDPEVQKRREALKNQQNEIKSRRTKKPSDVEGETSIPRVSFADEPNLNE